MGIDQSCYFTSEVPPPDPDYDFIATTPPALPALSLLLSQLLFTSGLMAPPLITALNIVPLVPPGHPTYASTTMPLPKAFPLTITLLK